MLTSLSRLQDLLTSLSFPPLKAHKLENHYVLCSAEERSTVTGSREKADRPDPGVAPPSYKAGTKSKPNREDRCQVIDHGLHDLHNGIPKYAVSPRGGCEDCG